MSENGGKLWICGNYRQWELTLGGRVCVCVAAGSVCVRDEARIWSPKLVVARQKEVTHTASQAYSYSSMRCIASK